MSNAIKNYNDLVLAVKELAEDVGTELEAYMPTAIDNAELRLTREVNGLDLVYTSSIVVAASTPNFTKPAGHLVTYQVTYTDPNTNKSVPLEKKTDSYLDAYWPQATSVGSPKYYTELDRNTFRIAPACSNASYFKIRGERRPPVLSSANQTNVFTSTMPNMLFYATMMEVAMWQRNFELLSVFEGQYVAARDGIATEGERAKDDDGTVNSGTNTLSNAGK